MITNPKYWNPFLILISSLFMLSCSPNGKQESVSAPLGIIEGQVLGGLEETPIPSGMRIDSVQIQMVEAFPLQVNIVVEGKLPDSCYQVGEANQDRTGNTFTVELSMTKQATGTCSGVPQPFRQVIPLNIDGLKAGIYTANVNGLTDNFELVVDNIVHWE